MLTHIITSWLTVVVHKKSGANCTLYPVPARSSHREVSHFVTDVYASCYLEVTFLFVCLFCWLVGWSTHGSSTFTRHRSLSLIQQSKAKKRHAVSTTRARELLLLLTTTITIIMEGDYFDYEQNLSTSFDSEQHAKPRKRQRLQETSITDASPLPVSADTRRNSEADKGTQERSELVHSV